MGDCDVGVLQQYVWMLSVRNILSTIDIVNLGSGNLGSIVNAFEKLGFETKLVTTAEEIMGSEKLLLPGVGTADYFLDQLRQDGRDCALNEAVLERGAPFLGICVGMQVLAENTLENCHKTGLGWCSGNVKPLDQNISDGTQVPHMGFNDVSFSHEVFGRIGFKKTSAPMYFCHGYAISENECNKVCAEITYGDHEFVAAISKDNWLAVQFHPEKSQLPGLQLLQAFAEWQP